MTSKSTDEIVARGEAMNHWRGANPLRVFRVAHDQTQLVVARAMEVSEQTVKSWEWGDSLPSLKNVKRLADVMLYGDGDMALGRLVNNWLVWMEARP